jgi:hypothetical protein
MDVRKLIALAAVVPLALAGAVSAQTTTPTTTPGTTTGPALAAQAEFVQRLQPGLTNAIVGIITLDATRSSETVTVNSVPISVSATNGANLSALTECSLFTTTGIRLTTGGNAVSAITGSNTLKLDTPLNIPGGQGALLVLRCNVASNAAVNGLLTIGMSPAAFQATSARGPVVVTQGNAATGLPGTNSQAIVLGGSGGSGTPTPGLPNTGGGGEALTLLALLVLLTAAGFLALRMRRM